MKPQIDVGVEALDKWDEITNKVPFEEYINENSSGFG